MLRPAMFPSTSSSLPKRFESLNATQRRAPTSPSPSNGHAQGSSPNRPNTPQNIIVIKDDKFFLLVEEELHDLRRVHTHGQEDDLRMCLGKCMERVGELAGLLSEAYASITMMAQLQSNSRIASTEITAMESKMRSMKVELDDVKVELDVTRSNLQMIEKNNEMLEEAVKSLSSQHGTNPRDVGSVGWRRSTPSGSTSSSSIHVNTQSTDHNHATGGTGTPPTASPPLSASIATSESAHAMPPPPVPVPQQPPHQESRFFKFRFNSSSSSFSTASNSSRPQTPTPGPEASPTIPAQVPGHNTSLSSSSSSVGDDETASHAHTNSGDHGSQLQSLRRDFDALKTQISKDKDELARYKAELSKSRDELGKNKEMLEAEKRKRVKEEESRKALEEELESLSQALFEEANNMVATERKLRAQSETNFLQQQEEMKEELREARAQREALKSALKLVEGEMGVLRTGTPTLTRSSEPKNTSQSTTESTGTVPRALDLHLDPKSKPPSQDAYGEDDDDDDDIPESSASYAVLPQTASTISPYPRSTPHSPTPSMTRSTSLSRSRSSSRDGIKSIPSSRAPSRAGTPSHSRETSHSHVAHDSQSSSSIPVPTELEPASKVSAVTPVPPTFSSETEEFEMESEPVQEELAQAPVEDFVHPTTGFVRGILGIEERSPWAD